MQDWRQIGERVIELARRLVAIPSVVDTDGEAAIADLLAGHLREQSVDLPGVEVTITEVSKPTACRAIMACAPAPIETRRALVLLGHIDTVGLEPYGPLAGSALDSAALKEHFAASDDPQLAAAAQSDEWAFGRGWLDMKGGVAAICEVFLHEARLKQLPAHLILLLTPDEESASRGLRALMPGLRALVEGRGLELSHVVNADYIAPLTASDERRYFYSGVVGKLLVGLSVFGRQTHVGSTFEGVNASALGGFLAWALEHDRKLLAGVAGEWLPPPTVLHVADRRKRYDVMTADCAELYLNVFQLAPEPGAWWRELLGEVRRQIRRYDREMRRRYQRFVARADLEPARYQLRPEVIDYAELKARVAAQGVDITGLTDRLTGEARERHMDERQRALSVIRGLEAQLKPGRPLVVVSLLPPFYPAQLSDPREERTARLVALAGEQGLKHRRAYPYISDMSYFSFDPQSGLEHWAAQSPLWFDDGELELYQALATRVSNIGPWGAGAHTAEERVHLPFLGEQLPRLLSGALYALAED
jgi:arginine utilization protein RocB